MDWFYLLAAAGLIGLLLWIFLAPAPGPGSLPSTPRVVPGPLVVRTNPANPPPPASPIPLPDPVPVPTPPQPMFTNGTRVASTLSTTLVVRLSPGISNPAPVVPSATPGAGSTNNLPPALEPQRGLPAAALAQVTDWLQAQAFLARRGFSAGAMDGKTGYQTRAALRAFQARESLPVTGALDPATRARLGLGPSAQVLTQVTLAASDLEGLAPVPPTWVEKSKRGYLGYESLLESLSERFATHPDLMRRLNPGLDWDRAQVGQTVVVPEYLRPVVKGKAAFLRIELAARALRAFDSETNLLAHLPCSIAQRVDKRPVGVLKVIAVVDKPNYRFDPAVFPESAEARRLKGALIIPPGPNCPVGTVWIGLNRPGYGIHGTPRPEDVGRTESHGCFRLANWNAEFLLQLVWGGMPVYVEP